MLARRILATSLLVTMFFAAALLAGCGGTTASFPSGPTTPIVDLTSSDVQALVQNAATAANSPMVIAVVDRLGRILAIYHPPGAPATAAGNFGVSVNTNDLAVS